MTDLINGRTTEEIKLALKVCNEDDCLPCPYEMGYICSDYMIRDALALIEYLEAQQPTWISVKDQLPDSRRNILTVNGHGVIRIMALWGYAGEKWKWIENKKFKYYNDITHWMPLHEPPKGE